MEIGRGTSVFDRQSDIAPFLGPAYQMGSQAPEDWSWLIDELKAAGAGSLRASPDWEWVTFRSHLHELSVFQIVRFPVDGAYGVSRYDSKHGTCELLGDFSDARTALKAVLS